MLISHAVSVCVGVQYGSHTLQEDTPVGHTVLTIKATDADDPESGSSFINFLISAGNDDDVFAVETDGKGVGQLVIAKVWYLCFPTETQTYTDDFMQPTDFDF